MTDQELQILAKATAIQRIYDHLTPLDFRVLGAVQDASGGLPLSYVRAEPGFFCTMSAFKPSTERLLAAGLITRESVAYEATNYKGKAGRAPRLDVIFKIKKQEYVL